MTVKQLMNKLKKMPEDAIITVDNDSCWVDGVYKATEVKHWEHDNTVNIGTDYKKLLEER